MADTRTISVWERWSSLLIRDPLIYLHTVVLGTLSLLCSLFDRSGALQHDLARAWSWMLLKTAGCELKVIGGENLNPSQPCIFAVNHISALDIPVVYRAIPFQFRIMAKKELFRYPFLGWHLRRSGQIPIERENARSSLRGLISASQTVRSGMSLLVFPEGGRSADGHIKEFLGGAFYVAIKAQSPIVPMAITGSFEALPMNSFVFQPRTLTLVVGQPISSEDFVPREIDKLAAIVRRSVEDLYYPRAEVSDPRAVATATVTSPAEG